MKTCRSSSGQDSCRTDGREGRQAGGGGEGQVQVDRERTAAKRKTTYGPHRGRPSCWSATGQRGCSRTRHRQSIPHSGKEGEKKTHIFPCVANAGIAAKNEICFTCRCNAISPSVVCYTWLSRCFLGILPWSELCHLFWLCSVLGSDYAVYFCVAALRHAQQRIMKAAAAQDNGDGRYVYTCVTH